MDYAQARLQARFGERPGEALWQELERAPQAAAALELARHSPLKRWVAGIAPQADRHAIETALRTRWRACVTEIAAWMPEAWRPAMLWTRDLSDLPALARLTRGEPPASWMLDDPALKVLASSDPADRAFQLRESGRAFLLAPPQARLLAAWLERWRGLWPRWGDRAALDCLAALLAGAMRQPPGEGRQRLARELRRLFRLSVLSPAAAFVYLAFAALDLMRLRAALLRPAMEREGIS